MLTTVPDSFIEHGKQISFRKSMIKFPSSNFELGINSYSKIIPCYLNRQLITLLSSRGIADRVFLTLLRQMIEDIDEALSNNESSKKLLICHALVDSKYDLTSLFHHYDSMSLENAVDDESYMTAMTSAYHMLSHGFNVKECMYLQGLLHSLRSKLLLGIRTKSRIIVRNGVCLLGVMDETNSLKPGEVFMRLSDNRNKDFTPLYHTNNNSSLVFGQNVLVGRNPSLYPGDLRVLKLVDIPSLQEYVDVLVFPSYGPRPHCDEMSGGDLDGDLYFIIWDQALIPTNGYDTLTYAKQDFSSDSLKTNSNPSEPITITIKHVQDFFVDYIKNDNLGRIANLWLVHADMSGADSDNCRQLAELHSTAVDFVKSGVPADFPRGLEVDVYPSFMENHRKPSYESSKVLGQIHNACKHIQLTKPRLRLHLDESLLIAGAVTILARLCINYL